MLWILVCYHRLRGLCIPVKSASWPLDPLSVKFLIIVSFIYSLPFIVYHSMYPHIKEKKQTKQKKNRHYFMFGLDENKAIPRGFRRREMKVNEDEILKEIVAGRLRFAAHQRGLRQGLAGEEKPIEAKHQIKFLRHCLESLTRGTVNNKEHHLDFTPPRSVFLFHVPKHINRYLNNLMLFWIGPVFPCRLPHVRQYASEQVHF